jgi:2C-methyl-D-erythritol 2,4-cyclodiphosphate synthase
LNVDIDMVSVKATTHEKMGFIGRGEALACECVCLVSND